MKSVIYKEHYMVYEDGRVWSNKTNKWMSTNITKQGYRRSLGNFHHRIIAECFIPNPENKSFVNHLNGIKHDNRICNLEWSTPAENLKHSFIELNREASNKRLTKEDVIEIRNSTLSSRKLADIYGVSKTNILNIKANKIWKSDYL